MLVRPPSSNTNAHQTELPDMHSAPMFFSANIFDIDILYSESACTIVSASEVML